MYLSFMKIRHKRFTKCNVMGLMIREVRERLTTVAIEHTRNRVKSVHVHKRANIFLPKWVERHVK